MADQGRCGGHEEPRNPAVLHVSGCCEAELEVQRLPHNAYATWCSDCGRESPDLVRKPDPCQPPHLGEGGGRDG